MVQTSTVTGMHHVGLSVSDLQRAVGFYVSATGLAADAVRQSNSEPWSSLSEHGDAPVNTTALKGPNLSIELAELATGPSEPLIPVEGPGITHLCFQSPAGSELYRAFVAAGASEVSREAPVDLGGYGVRYGYARDPDGTMFEVEQLDDPPFDDPVWIAHVALVSPDIDRLVEFYEQFFGVSPYRRANKLVGPRIDEVTGLDDVRIRAAWFNVGNAILELWEYVHPATPPPEGPRPFDAAGVNRFVFEVDDLDAGITRLADLGVEMLAPPAGRADGREVYARDPDGNLFGIVEFPTGSAASVARLARITWM